MATVSLRKMSTPARRLLTRVGQRLRGIKRPTKRLVRKMKSREYWRKESNNNRIQGILNNPNNSLFALYNSRFRVGD